MTKSQSAFRNRTLSREEWKEFYQFVRARRAAGDPRAASVAAQFEPCNRYHWQSFARGWAFEMKTDSIPF